MNFILFFPTVFMLSGFNRTLCGSAWDSLSSTNDLSTTGRLGCCAAGKFMSKPQLDPFVASTACANCPAGKYSTANNAYSSCIDCAKGKYMLTSITASTVESNCKQCEVSKHSDVTATTAACKKCGAGTYGYAVLLTQCKSCITGRYDTRTGLSHVNECKLCPVGQHQATARQTSCVNCATAKFAEVVGHVSDGGFWLSCFRCSACLVLVYCCLEVVFCF